MVALLKQALEAGRAEVERRLLAAPSAGRLAAQATAFLIDQIVRLSYDFTTHHLYPASNRTAGERITVIAVGGYGRGEMAPHSDVDIGFVTPFKQTSWTEQVIEAQLYRSEEHTSELQSLRCTSYAVFCLQKKKKQ